MENKLSLDQIKQCFYFGPNDHHKYDCILITKENAEKIQRHGWIVSFHTDYYINTISAKYDDFVIGFGSWMDDLKPYIVFCDDSQELLKIKNREQLDSFLQLIESLHQFSKVIS